MGWVCLGLYLWDRNDVATDNGAMMNMYLVMTLTYCDGSISMIMMMSFNVDAAAVGDIVDPQAEIQRLRAELAQEREERNFFQLERVLLFEHEANPLV